MDPQNEATRNWLEQTKEWNKKQLSSSSASLASSASSETLVQQASHTPTMTAATPRTTTTVTSIRNFAVAPPRLDSRPLLNAYQSLKLQQSVPVLRTPPPGASATSSPQQSSASIAKTESEQPQNLSDLFKNTSSTAQGLSTHSSYLFSLRSIRPARTHLQRRNPYQKDLVIATNGVIHNVVRCFNKIQPGMNEYTIVPPDEYAPGAYNLFTHLIVMSRDERKKFFAKSEVEVSINLQDYEDPNLKSLSGALGMIDALGSEFPHYTRRLTVKLMFMSDHEFKGSTDCIPKISKLNSNAKANAKGNGFDIFERPSVHRLMPLIQKLQNFKYLQTLLIHLCVPHGTLHADVINHVLPFYELNFVNWKVSLQHNIRLRPTDVYDWALMHLDIESERIAKEKQNQLVAANNELARHMITYGY